MIQPRDRTWLLALIFAAIVLLVGCDHDRHSSLPDPLMDVFTNLAEEENFTRQQTLGKRLFLQYCETCHGAMGRGDGQNAYNLDPKPPDFSKTLKLNSPSYWEQIIEGGTVVVGRSPLCPPWGLQLTRREIQDLVSYMEFLSDQTDEPDPTSLQSSQDN